MLVGSRFNEIDFAIISPHQNHFEIFFCSTMGSDIVWAAQMNCNKFKVKRSSPKHISVHLFSCKKQKKRRASEIYAVLLKFMKCDRNKYSFASGNRNSSHMIMSIVHIDMVSAIELEIRARSKGPSRCRWLKLKSESFLPLFHSSKEKRENLPAEKENRDKKHFAQSWEQQTEEERRQNVEFYYVNDNLSCFCCSRMKHRLVISMKLGANVFLIASSNNVCESLSNSLKHRAASNAEAKEF